MGYKSVDLIRSAWKRFVLIVQPLQFHYSLGPSTRPVRRRGNSNGMVVFPQ
jgi:hypothetical protein